MKNRLICRGYDSVLIHQTIKNLRKYNDHIKDVLGGVGDNILCIPSDFSGNDNALPGDIVITKPDSVSYGVGSEFHDIDTLNQIMYYLDNEQEYPYTFRKPRLILHNFKK